MYLLLFFISGILASFLDLTDSNQLEIYKTVIDGDLPILINLLSGDCSTAQCRRYLQEANEVAKIVKSQTRFA